MGDALTKLELVDPDGTIWVGLHTCRHWSKSARSDVRVYRFVVDETANRYCLDGGALVGEALYVGVPSLRLKSGDIPQHVLDGLGRAVRTKKLE